MVTLEQIFLHNIGYKDSRRSQERKDAKEIREDHSKMANLPTEVIHKEWQKNCDHPSAIKNDVVHNKDYGF